MRDVFIQWMYTHTEICNHVLERNKTPKKRLNFNKKVKKDPKRYSSSHLLKETMKKRSTLASNTSSFNGCRCLTCFIVTLIIDTVHFFLTEKIPGGETPLRLPYRHWSETRENELSLVWNSVRIWRSGRHNPTVNSQEYPPSPGEKIFCQLGLPWAAWSINSYKSWSLIACLQSILCSQHPLRAYGMPTPHAG